MKNRFKFNVTAPRPKLHYPHNKRHDGIVVIDFAVDALYVNAPDMHGVTRLRPQ